MTAASPGLDRGRLQHMSFVGLCTGVMNSGDNIERWQRLTDIAVSAAI